MSETVMRVLAWLAGGLIGAVFFGGLWWTVRKAFPSKWAPLWFSVSLLLRTGVALTGFYVVAAGHWARMLLCLLGFVMARLVVARLTRPAGKPTCLAQES